MKKTEKKKVLLVSQYFYPENFKGNDIAFDFQKKGFEVSVLTGIPNYPKGSYYPGYGLFKRRVEILNGVKVYRVAHIPRGHNKIQLAFNYLSFVILSCFWIVFLSFKNRYEAIFVQGLSPIIQALPAIFFKKIRKTKVYLWVLDIWPDAMMSGGGIKNKYILSVMNAIVKYIYKNTDKILISSKKFRESINSKGDFADKIEYFPNWSDDYLLTNKNSRWDEIKTLIPKGFICMMAGNLGKAQDILSVLKAAKITSWNKKIKWVFIGDGSMKEVGEQYVKDNSLIDTVFFLGRYSQEDMKYFYASADVMLLTLRSQYSHLKMVVPARLQSYMSAQKAIIGMIDGGAADLIHEANCGKVVSAGDFDSLANLALEFSMLDLSNYACNSRNYFIEKFTREGCINNLIKIMNLK